MRTVTESYNVYNYPELSAKAKEKANQWYLDAPYRSQDLLEIYTEGLRRLFPNSKLKVQFSLNYCQGNGLNIYGSLDLTDIFRAIRGKPYCGGASKGFRDILTEHEWKTIEAYMEVCGRDIELPYNNSRYAYCVSDKTDFAEEWMERLVSQRYKKIQAGTIQKLQKSVADMFVALAGQYEKDGYKYFYEPDGEEIAEACEANGWEFLEDGTFYAA